jgi:hypothetical protein
MRPVLRADNLITSFRLSGNVAALTSWNPKGLSSPVKGLIYLFPVNRRMNAKEDQHGNLEGERNLVVPT